MLDILLVFLFVWLLVKVLGLLLKAAWGTAKIVASLLFAVALPLLGVCLVFAGGMLLLVPLALIGIAFAVLKACV